MTDQTFQGFGTPEQNWSKLPHALIAALPTIKSASELKVILYILRHTWGFHETEKRISLDEFANGRKRRGGERLDGGTGMSVPAIRSGIKRAIEHGFITVETDDSDKARVKKYYSLNQTVKSLPPDCKKVTSRVQETCNRTKKETIETNQERHVASATPALADDSADEQRAYWGEEVQFGTAVEVCPDCGKHKRTTVDMPFKNQTCTCEHERELQAAFGDPKPPPAVEVTPTPHWREQAAQPGATWGEHSEEFRRQLEKYDGSGRKVQALGYDFERLFGLAPDWENKNEVKSWSSGLWACLRAAGGDAKIVLDATEKAKRGGLTISKPYSAVEVTRALFGERRCTPSGSGKSGGMGSGIVYA